MTPKKKARKAVKAKIRDIIRSGGATPVTVIVDRVNAAVAGWVNYFRVGNSSRAFSEVRDYLEMKIRRVPPILLALTHVDELRPAKEWAPPYDTAAPAGPKARAIRAAVDAVARALDLPADAIVPVAMPPGWEPYNLDALWARIAVELDEAKLVQLDRLRVGQQRLSLRELADQLGHAGSILIKGIVKA